jgi:RNA polymerase sporulation-specific sigma factor
MLCINDLPKAFTDKENLLYLSKLKLGNISVREELIAHNLRLVAMVLDRYIKENTEEKEDLFEVGVIGLIKAIDNFDFRFGAKLSTYAVPFIIGEIRRYIYENRSLLHITRSIKKQSLSILKFEEEYFAIHGKHPTNEVIKKEFGIDEYTLMMAKNSVKTISSIQAPIVDVEERPFEDVLASGKDDFERMVKKIDIEAVLSQLNSKQQQVFRCRYVEGLTQIETAKILKISQAQVSRLESNMLKRIRVDFSLANISDSSNVSYQGSEEELKRKSIVERAKKQLLITFFPSNIKEIVEAIHKAQLSEEEKKYLIC